MKTIQIHPLDNVAVVLSEQSACQAVPRGHKIARCPIAKGEAIIKYSPQIQLPPTLSSPCTVPDITS